MRQRSTTRHPNVFITQTGTTSTATTVDLHAVLPVARRRRIRGHRPQLSCRGLYCTSTEGSASPEHHEDRSAITATIRLAWLQAGVACHDSRSTTGDSIVSIVQQDRQTGTMHVRPSYTCARGASGPGRGTRRFNSVASQWPLTRRPIASYDSTPARTRAGPDRASFQHSPRLASKQPTGTGGHLHRYHERSYGRSGPFHLFTHRQRAPQRAPESLARMRVNQTGAPTTTTIPPA